MIIIIILCGRQKMSHIFSRLFFFVFEQIPNVKEQRSTGLKNCSSSGSNIKTVIKLPSYTYFTSDPSPAYAGVVAVDVVIEPERLPSS